MWHPIVSVEYDSNLLDIQAKSGLSCVDYFIKVRVWYLSHILCSVLFFLDTYISLKKFSKK